MDLEQQVEQGIAAVQNTTEQIVAAAGAAFRVPQSFLPFVSVVGIALAVVLVCELGMYLLVYRTQDYQESKSLVDSQQRRVQKEKAKVEKKEKKLQNLENKINLINSSLMKVKFKGFALTAVLSIGAIRVLGELFDNVLVARLPFEPFNFLKSMTQSGLVEPGDRDCGYLFIYILSTMLFRSAVQYTLDLENAVAKKPHSK